jgi:hypothetical protein
MKLVFSILLITLIFSSCVEERYYRKHDRHSREYYEHRHMEVPVGVELRIHN